MFPLSGAFAGGWKLSTDLIKVRPGEVELKGDKEAHGYIRVTRAGCVAVALKRYEDVARDRDEPKQFEAATELLSC